MAFTSGHDAEVQVDQQSRNAFILLVALQAAHVFEEYSTGLYEWGLPALVSAWIYPSEPRFGFLAANAAFLAFGVWCYLARVRPGHDSAIFWASLWVIVELFNGLLHPLLALVSGGYFPGLLTAPLLLVVAIFLANRLARTPSSTALRGAGR